jgi:hypothetical protein
VRVILSPRAPLAAVGDPRRATACLSVSHEVIVSGVIISCVGVP